MSGKGSTRRPCDEDKVRNNWDTIFGKKIPPPKQETQLKEQEDEDEKLQRTSPTGS